MVKLAQKLELTPPAPKYKKDFKPSTGTDCIQAKLLTAREMEAYTVCTYCGQGFDTSKPEVVGWQKTIKGSTLFFCCGGHYVTWAADSANSEFDRHHGRICSRTGCNEYADTEWVRRNNTRYSFYCSMEHRDGKGTGGWYFKTAKGLDGVPSLPLTTADTADKSVGCQYCGKVESVPDKNNWCKVKFVEEWVYFCSSEHYLERVKNEIAEQYKIHRRAGMETCRLPTCLLESRSDFARRHGAEYFFYCSADHLRRGYKHAADDMRQVAKEIKDMVVNCASCTLAFEFDAAAGVMVNTAVGTKHFCNDGCKAVWETYQQKHSVKCEGCQRDIWPTEHKTLLTFPDRLPMVFCCPEHRDEYTTRSKILLDHVSTASNGRVAVATSVMETGTRCNNCRISRPNVNTLWFVDKCNKNGIKFHYCSNVCHNQKTDKDVEYLAQSALVCARCSVPLNKSILDAGAMYPCWFDGHKTQFYCSDFCKEITVPSIPDRLSQQREVVNDTGARLQLTSFYCYGCGTFLPNDPDSYPSCIKNGDTARFCAEECKSEWWHRCDAAQPIVPGAGSDPIAGSYYHRNFKGHDIDAHEIIRLYGLEYFKGTALTYIVRAGVKHDNEVEDLEKAIATLQKRIRHIKEGK